jgi:small GTP-binding protein
MHYRDADGCILVYDVTDRDSYDNIEKEWLKEIKEKAPEKTQIVLIGNKCDLQEKVNEEEADKFATENGFFLYKLVSAKKN